MQLLRFTLLAMVCCSPVFAQEVARPNRATQGKLKGIVGEMSEAMKAEDEDKVRWHSQQAIELMGDQAGLIHTMPVHRITTSWFGDLQRWRR